MKLQHLSIHGHRVALRTAGEGPVVLLVHGMAGTSATWNHVLPALAQRFTVIAPDLLGHGESGKPRRGEYSLGAHANVLRDLLQVLGHERATFVGQSLGGGVAMQMAYQFPERCERLVLVSSGGLGREVSMILRALAFPGAEYVFPLVCSPRIRNAGSLVASFLRSAGLRAAPAVEEIWRSYASLAETDTRRAFFRTLHAVIDVGSPEALKVAAWALWRLPYFPQSTLAIAPAGSFLILTQRTSLRTAPETKSSVSVESSCHPFSTVGKPEAKKVESLSRTFKAARTLAWESVGCSPTVATPCSTSIPAS